MSNIKRYTSYFLILIFGFLFIKNVSPIFDDNFYLNCQEIGHIHKYNLNRIQSNLQNRSVYNSRLLEQPNTTNDHDCHSGKSVLNIPPFPVAIYDLKNPTHDINFILAYSLEPHFQSPIIEPNRKPPKPHYCLLS